MGEGRGYARRVRRARKLARLSARAVAKALGVSKDTYRQFERNQVLPISLLAAFCQLTDCSPHYLLTGRPYLVIRNRLD